MATTVQGEGERRRHPRRAEAERWSFVEEADGGLKKSAVCCFWDLRTGLPSPLGISEMSPMDIGLIAACRNITRRPTQASCHTLRRHSSSRPEEQAPCGIGIAMARCSTSTTTPHCRLSCGPAAVSGITTLSEAAFAIAPSNNQQQSGTPCRGWPWQRKHPSPLKLPKIAYQLHSRALVTARGDSRARR